MNTKTTRRDFLKLGAGAGLGLGVLPLAAADRTVEAAVPEKVPLVAFGKTGVKIPRLVLGTGSRFCTIASPEESDRFLNRALELGLFYWDTASAYENKKMNIHSEERLARVLAKRRKEVHLSTKLSLRKPEEAKRELEGCFRRLGVDRVDQLMIHDVRSKEDNAELLRKGGVVELMHKWKGEGLCEIIGFSGHGDAEAMKEIVDHGGFDCLLMALNHWGNGKFPREQVVLPAAKKKGMGILVMKAVRPCEKNPNLKPLELIRYALTLPQPDALVIGIERQDYLEANARLAIHFEPLPPADMKRLARSWRNLHEERAEPWRQHGYKDGLWS